MKEDIMFSEYFTGFKKRLGALGKEDQQTFLQLLDSPAGNILDYLLGDEMSFLGDTPSEPPKKRGLAARK